MSKYYFCKSERHSYRQHLSKILKVSDITYTLYFIRLLYKIRCPILVLMIRISGCDYYLIIIFFLKKKKLK